MKLFSRKKAREAADEKEFKETYGVESLKVEY